MTNNPTETSQGKQTDAAAAGLSVLPNGYQTARLSVTPWRAVLRDDRRLQALEEALSVMLTEPVLRHLPERVHLPKGPDAIKAWIAQRDQSAALYLVEADTGLAGLMFLFRPVDAPTDGPMHLGYLFGEDSWGKGFASEMACGLVEALATGPKFTLQGGVDVANPASARVLEKAGLEIDEAQSNDETSVFLRQVGGRN
ncbi:MAG: GNAT family N-acetyltransferase [Pelagimonas sp.]|uniref:GNAT family N-acetyltransferase n=1 Tax=Pelagimonas sp. TaxID=2073170 RepID=UPI003D6A546D